MIYNVIRIFYIDKLSIVTIEIYTYFFMLKFNKNEINFKSVL